MKTFCIEARHLKVVRGERVVLRDISLEIQSGEFVAVVGKSGAGKSTFLHTLAGHLPYTGELHMPKHIGMVFQKNAVFPWMTVEQNVSFGQPINRVHWKEHVAHSMHMAGIEEKAKEYPAKLSGGQMQRVAIAREFARKPDVLLMDEPFGALDAITRETMQKWLLDVWKNKQMTILMVTHSIEEAIILADRIIILHDGKIGDQFSDFHPSLRNTDARFSAQFSEMRQTIAASLIHTFSPFGL